MGRWIRSGTLDDFSLKMWFFHVKDKTTTPMMA